MTYNQEYYQKNGDEIRRKRREKYAENGEKERENSMNYYHEVIKNNPVRLARNKACQQVYNQSAKGIEARRKNSWFKQGIRGDLNIIFRIFESTKFCDDCGAKFQGDNEYIKCLDHDHTNKFIQGCLGNFRGIVCIRCNQRRERKNYDNSVVITKTNREPLGRKPLFVRTI
tara:strand:- start:310 stop:822 length:513 start_codon:yes stop_codon:yes gene_type:complete